MIRIWTSLQRCLISAFSLGEAMRAGIRAFSSSHGPLLAKSVSVDNGGRMALCFVTQIVENNYSVVDSNVKLRSNNCIIFQPSTRSRDCGERVHLQGASPFQGTPKFDDQGPSSVVSQ